MVTRSDDEIRMKPTALIALMVAVLGGNFYVTSVRTEPEVVRPDPFTGSEGRVLANRIEHLEKRIDALRENMYVCLDHLSKPH